MIASATNRNLISAFPLLLAAVASAAPPAGPPRYVNSHQLVLSFKPTGDTHVDDVLVWISADEGQTWSATEATRTAEHAVQIELIEDGKYFLYLILSNSAGPSSTPPSSDSTPHAVFIVDTASPALQLHRTEQEDPPPASGEPLRLRVSLIEENLADGATRLFYRSNADKGWQDGGTAFISNGLLKWALPAEIGPTIDVRVVATDRAGNRAVDEIHDISITPRPVTPSPPSQDATQAGHEESGEAVPESPHVAPLPPVTLDPVPPITLDDQPWPAPETSRPPRKVLQNKHLRDQAATYLAQGHLSLAGARLREALELSPGDPDLSVDLASVLYRSGRYDEADRLFQDALSGSPEHPGAIEGLALVAATQNRYAQARSHLQHLLRLSPDAADHWLHYGDVEHMLGNTAAARRAWQKVLEVETADKTAREKAQKRLKLFGRKRIDLN